MYRSDCFVKENNNNLHPNFSEQYFHTYVSRLQSQNDILQRRIIEKWGDSYPVKSVADVVTDEMCVIFGTVYKNMKNKPSVIKELTESCQLGGRVVLPDDVTLLDPSDKIFLEDGQQRIELEMSAEEVGGLVTGVTMAVLGLSEEEDRSRFQPKEFVFPTPFWEEESGDIKKDRLEDGQSRYLLVLSGLQLRGDGSEEDNRCQRQVGLLMDWVCGRISSVGSGVALAGVNPIEIGRLLLLGNCLARTDDPVGEDDNEANHTATKRSLAALDTLLATWSLSIPVDLVPDISEPITSPLLPQPAPHRVLFPLSRRLASFQTRTNPIRLLLPPSDRLLTGISSSILADLMRHLSDKSPLSALQRCLEWGHLAPTAPNTLLAAPLQHMLSSNDPLCLPQNPSLLLAAHPRHEATTIVSPSGRSCLLATVPPFSSTGSALLVDLRNLSCRIISLEGL